MNKMLYIIGGCNGAGKTTASYTVLPDILNCREFVNADEIAHGLSPFNPADVAIEAGRLMLKRIEELLAREESFSIETTLATRSYVNLVRRAKEKDYRVSLLIKIRMQPKDIATLTAHSKESIASTRSRLYQKVFGKKGSTKDWDDFILSI